MACRPEENKFQNPKPNECHKQKKQTFPANFELAGRWNYFRFTAGKQPRTNWHSTANPATNAPARARRAEILPANPKLPSLFLIGDSTVRNGQGNGAGGQWGWGDFLAPFFDTNQINVVNRALGGTSSRTFYRDQWPRVLELVKPGDFVIMQFGHNDGSPVNETVLTRAPARAAQSRASAMRRRKSPISSPKNSRSSTRSAGMKKRSSPKRGPKARRRWFAR